MASRDQIVVDGEVYYSQEFIVKLFHKILERLAAKTDGKKPKPAEPGGSNELPR